MKRVIEKANTILKPMGYLKKGMNFWMFDNGIYKLIDFQKSKYREKCFFVNFCIHPVGLPKLQIKNFSIVEHPKEYECIIRQRIDNIDERLTILKDFISVDDDDALTILFDCLSSRGIEWLNYWGRFDNIANAKERDVCHMITAVPILKKKAFYMLKFYCFLKLLDKKKASFFLEKYFDVKINGMDFKVIDNYFQTLVKEIGK